MPAGISTVQGSPAILGARRRSILLGGSATAFSAGFCRCPITPALRVSEAIHLGMYVSGYAAKHGGFFRKHGLDVTMASAGGIALAIPAVLSGNAAIVVTGAGMSANAVGEGARPFAELPQVRRR